MYGSCAQNHRSRIARYQRRRYGTYHFSISLSFLIITHNTYIISARKNTSWMCVLFRAQRYGKISRGERSVFTFRKYWSDPIHRAICRNRMDIVKLLVAGGCNLKAKTAEQETPLDWAKKFGRKDIQAFWKISTLITSTLQT